MGKSAKMSDIFFESARSQLQALDANVQVVFIHPRYQQHREFLRFLIAEYPDIFYWRATPKATSDVFATSFDAMGSHVIFDEYDVMDSATGRDLITRVLSYWQAHQIANGRIFIFTRDLPLFDKDFQPKIALIPVIEPLLLCDYMAHPEKHRVEVYSLGFGRVWVDGHEITQWEGRLPRAMFFYLVDKGIVTRDSIFQTFWPNLSVKEATNVFHVTKRKVGDILGVDLTMYRSGFYTISSDIELYYDVIQFGELIQNGAISDDSEAHNLLSLANHIYQGDFLQGSSFEWVTNRREALRQTYGESLIQLADIATRQQSPSQAIGYYLRASRLMPLREDVVMRAMELYVQLHMPKHALELYKRLALKPSPALISLADSIQSTRPNRA